MKNEVAEAVAALRENPPHWLGALEAVERARLQSRGSDRAALSRARNAMNDALDGAVTARVAVARALRHLERVG